MSRLALEREATGFEFGVPEQIIQIVPRLPPDICGVGDYALRVGEKLSAHAGVQYVSSTANPTNSDESHAIAFGDGGRFAAKLGHVCGQQRTVVLLHFSGYGYGRRGICGWLIRGLKQFLREHPNARLLTMFHELWVPGHWCSKAGFLARWQRRNVRDLCAISHAVRTNRAASARHLGRFLPAGDTEICALPVFSNLGELTAMDAFPVCRKPRLVIFQPPSIETHDGQRFWNSWSHVQKTLGPLPTVIAGKQRPTPDDERITKLGFLSETAASELLRDSQFAMVEYFPGYYAKSGIFAAMAAHGISCILPCKAESDEDGLFRGHHYVLTNDLHEVGVAALSRCGPELWDWYSNHSLAKTVDSYWGDIQRLHPN